MLILRASFCTLEEKFHGQLYEGHSFFSFDHNKSHLHHIVCINSYTYIHKLKVQAKHETELNLYSNCISPERGITKA